ncbi:hypothetical protein OOK31_39170 [Streptomyces sp. NBC_00249]|uniref:hypothetical protein n=1 Tax=Streptomyces sp. NBC_00249 TaxID=2975690 RepID=UPI0022582B8D|nr:hypothetical protein [Streptomyces sp. NBC_00249]MCX5199828.1 hypothetical protein [Streptomyces sp. NBC_00249]
MKTKSALGVLVLAAAPMLLASPAHADGIVLGPLRGAVGFTVGAAESALPPLSLGGDKPLIDPKRPDAVDDIVQTSFDTFLVVENADVPSIMPNAMNGATSVLATVQHTLLKSPPAG